MDEYDKALKSISKIIDNLEYDCRARTYTLDEDAMHAVFYCRDLADLVLREKKASEEDT